MSVRNRRVQSHQSWRRSHVRTVLLWKLNTFRSETVNWGYNKHTGINKLNKHSWGKRFYNFTMFLLLLYRHHKQQNFRFWCSTPPTPCDYIYKTWCSNYYRLYDSPSLALLCLSSVVRERIHNGLHLAHMHFFLTCFFYALHCYDLRICSHYEQQIPFVLSTM